MDEEESDGDERRRAPLSRSRRLSSRRRRKAEDEEKAEDEAGLAEASPESSAEDSPPPAPAASSEPEEDFTQSVPFSSASQPIEDDFSYTPPLPGERWASVTGSLRRFFRDFFGFALGFSRSASEYGQAFGRDVVKPFSSALLEASVSLVLLFAMGACGAYLGRYLKVHTLGRAALPAVTSGQVLEGKQGEIDDSAFGEGFSSEEINSRANRVLQSYLKAIQEDDFRTAYDLLSPAWRKELSFASFKNGYQATRVVGYSIGKAETVKQMQVKIKAEIKVEEDKTAKVLQATYWAVLTPQGWRLDAGTFEPL